MRSIWLDIGQVLCCVFMEAEVHKLAKKRTRPISSHIDRTSLVNRRFMYGFRENFSCRIQRAVPSGSHLSRSGSQSQRAIWSILPAHGASQIIIGNSTFWIKCHGLRFFKTSALIFQLQMSLPHSCLIPDISLVHSAPRHTPSSWQIRTQNT